MRFTKQALEKLDRVTRLRYINSISGIKPANLIGTKSKNGEPNLAIFSSVVHLGSQPALLGMISRPTDEVIRHTYDNIIETEQYTINHITTKIVEKAHYTSAKFEKDESEFNFCGLTESYVPNFLAPFVLESSIQIGMQLVEIVPIAQNGTILIIGEIAHLQLPDNSLDTEGDIDLAQLNGVGISGLNTYYELIKKAKYPYARRNEVPKFKN